MKKLLCFLLVAIVAVSGLSLRPNNARAINTGTILVSEEYTPPDLSFDSPYFEAFKSLLISQGYSVIVSNSVITQDLLSGVNVLIVHVPTAQYSSSEIDQIQAFVSSGGGLFCIADHTTSWRVDNIIARWGFSQASGYVTDSDNYVGEYDYWVYYEAARGNFAEHPITDGLAKVQSGCSNWFLDSLPNGSVSIITTDTDGTASPSGVSVYAALDTGMGKIVISMDSNYFGPSGDPQIGLDAADNAKLGLNTIAWLMGAAPHTHIYVDPSSSIFYSNETNVGTRFNITIWAENVVDLAAAEVYMEFDDSIINVTRWFEPKLDPEYVFYGRRTSALPTPPNDVNYGHLGPNKGKVLVTTMLFPPDPPYFSGSGKICIFEMEITAAPPVNGQLASTLHINAPDATYMLDGDGNIIPYVTIEDGFYAYIYGSGPLGVHDVAVLSATLSKTVVGEGYSVFVNVMVGNLGDYDEVFDVTVYAGESVIGMVFGVQLSPNNTLSLMLVWNTVEFTKGIYTVSVYASPVQGESNVDNNVGIAGNVLVTIPGDVNGDHKVGLKDIFAIALGFGSTAGGARYKPNVDVNGDGKINLKDYFIASKNFGQQW